ncbi:MAG: Gfo/Idh/MocA family oxidoreductase [Pirellulaceae bacterium]|jgi:predicted dehydrogenase|nr:Gfo/Idh/MocA family oxidoreductase [Pirellulaceae bacterium]MDP7304265.1 Gfo/Idh/MocA family oxidoreductase [Pirellulaceae bacterium]HJN10718.1 Gfo/Idh/MocA family oxidoreductase [Pirellulaceae bacterium]
MTCRLGVLGLTHDHIWDNLPYARDRADVTIAAVADPHAALRERAASQYGCAAYGDYGEMLDAETLDAVLVYADNATGPELVEMAAACGLHAMVEKPMAATLAGADRMLAAANANKTRLMVNWPFAWWPQMQHAISTAKSGAIGDVWQVRYRAAHAGPAELGCSDFFCDWLFDPKRNGPGGAYMDYCCYGALLAQVLLGRPESVWATADQLVKMETCPVPDNAVLVMRYPRGMAMSEGSWSQIGKMSAYLTLIYGTRGTLLLEPRHGGRLLSATEDNQEGVELPVPEVAPEMANSVSHFLHGIESGDEFWSLCDPRVCRDTQEILERGATCLPNDER